MALQLYWGDLHCHTGLSYGAGTPEAALLNGRAHVDFVAIIGHAFWPDMQLDAEDRTGWMSRHFGGFEKCRRLWASTRTLVERQNRPGHFVTFLGYEWHSDGWGDYNVLYHTADDDAALVGADDVAALKRHVATRRKALVWPHHVGYMPGARGLNWDCYTELFSPVVEVCSDHGEFEADDGGPNAVDSVGMGPRVTTSSVRAGLARGFRFGLIGSTDSHVSYPAAYNGGRAGVYASALTRDAIWEALLARRTVACKGDSIAAWFEADGAPLGSEIKARGAKVSLKGAIRAEDTVEKVELIRNEQVYRVWHPMEQPAPRQPSRVWKVRLQIGWGNPVHAATWQGRLHVRGGALRSVRPYFQPIGRQNPAEGGQQQLVGHDATGFEFKVLAHGFPQQFVAEVEGDRHTQFVLETDQAGLSARLDHLAHESVAARKHFHTSTAAKLCRAVPEHAYTFPFELVDPLGDLPQGRYYVRVTQQNLQRAWTSPVWVTA
jgi:hypothetical protein